MARSQPGGGRTPGQGVLPAENGTKWDVLGQLSGFLAPTHVDGAWWPDADSNLGLLVQGWVSWPLDDRAAHLLRPRGTLCQKPVQALGRMDRARRSRMTRLPVDRRPSGLSLLTCAHVALSRGPGCVRGDTLTHPPGGALYGCRDGQGKRSVRWVSSEHVARAAARSACGTSRVGTEKTTFSTSAAEAWAADGGRVHLCAWSPAPERQRCRAYWSQSDLPLKLEGGWRRTDNNGRQLG